MLLSDKNLETDVFYSSDVWGGASIVEFNDPRGASNKKCCQQVEAERGVRVHFMQIIPVKSLCLVVVFERQKGDVLPQPTKSLILSAQSQDIRFTHFDPYPSLTVEFNQPVVINLSKNVVTLDASVRSPTPGLQFSCFLPGEVIAHLHVQQCYGYNKPKNPPQRPEDYVQCRRRRHIRLDLDPNHSWCHDHEAKALEYLKDFKSNPNRTVPYPKWWK